jgi:UDP-glucuronate 4-epimerase
MPHTPATVDGQARRSLNSPLASADSVHEMRAEESTAKTYVVTGCGGFVGSHLAEALVARGDTVIGIESFTDYYARDLKEANVRALRDGPRFELLEADVLTAPLADVLADVDGIFHLAAQPGVRGSWGATFAEYVTRNVLVTQGIFEAAVAADVPVVYASSSSVYGNAETYPTDEDARLQPVSPYGVTKRTCEDLARVYHGAYGLSVSGLRYFTVYGPRQRPDMAFSRIVTALLEGTPFRIYGDGQQSRDFTFVADAVSATMAAMDGGQPSLVYNVGGGTEATLLEAIDILERLSRRTLDIELHDHARGDARRTAADTSRIVAELGWRPSVTLEQGLAAQLESALAVS